MPYLRSTVRAGVPYVLWGKAAKKNRQLVLEQPAVFSFEEYHRMRQHLKPVYPLTEGLSAKTIEKAVRQALESLPFFKETLPPAIRSKYHLAEYHLHLNRFIFRRIGNRCFWREEDWYLMNFICLSCTAAAEAGK